ncbi:hypothetical protein CYMTET_5478 [Cymbomonas tetramitiformis]|uniref:Uncharacterized protein n=1 Tax=Cymbomonas tetramitiformis TaxID=36881 RepID=A0AAE0GZB5_9CHLO|nr:hypothetical protein CYMTET_5478 [Cymbomonas tetramitiformis]
MHFLLLGAFVTHAQEEDDRFIIKPFRGEWSDKRHAEGKSDVYTLLRDRRDLRALGLVWNSLEISVTEEAGCPLQVVATLEETDVVATKEIPATRTKKTSLLELPPTGGAVKLNITCKSDEEGDYKLVISNELRPLFPACAGVGLFLVIIAPIVSSSVAFVYLGGTTLTFLLISLVILYKLSKNMGAKRTTPLAMMVFAVLPAEHRSTAFHYYLSTVLWPLQTISDHLLGNTGLVDDQKQTIVVGAACLLVWLCLLIGFLVVRNFAINKSTGEVDGGAAEVVIKLRRGGVGRGLGEGVSVPVLDNPVAIVMVVALFIPPGSYIVSGTFKVPSFPPAAACLQLIGLASPYAHTRFTAGNGTRF